MPYVNEYSTENLKISAVQLLNK